MKGRLLNLLTILSLLLSVLVAAVWVEAAAPEHGNPYEADGIWSDHATGRDRVLSLHRGELQYLVWERLPPRTGGPARSLVAALLGMTVVDRTLQTQPMLLSKPIHALPMRMPARKTRTPPTTTWNAALRNGVSM